MTFCYKELTCNKQKAKLPVKYFCKYRYRNFVHTMKRKLKSEQTDLFKEGGPLIWFPLPLLPSPTTAGSELVR